ALRPRSISRLFPYTTLFRSTAVPSPLGEVVECQVGTVLGGMRRTPWVARVEGVVRRRAADRSSCPSGGSLAPDVARDRRAQQRRSEEHTSELQSREKLVCRL